MTFAITGLSPVTVGHVCRWLRAECVNGGRQEGSAMKPGKTMASNLAHASADTLSGSAGVGEVLGWSEAACCCRKEWRRRTTTSTWRWPGRMAQWSSSKSRDILHSTNSWRHTAKDRYGACSNAPTGRAGCTSGNQHTRTGLFIMFVYLFTACNLNKTLLPSFLSSFLSPGPGHASDKI